MNRLTRIELRRLGLREGQQAARTLLVVLHSHARIGGNGVDDRLRPHGIRFEQRRQQSIEITLARRLNAIQTLLERLLAANLPMGDVLTGLQGLQLLAFAHDRQLRGLHAEHVDHHGDRAEDERDEQRPLNIRRHILKRRGRHFSNLLSRQEYSMSKASRRGPFPVVVS